MVYHAPTDASQDGTINLSGTTGDEKAHESRRRVVVRTLVLRRPRFASPAALLVCVVLVTAPLALASTFGTRYLDDARSFGTRVSITTPSARLHQAAAEFLLHRSVVQSAFVPRPYGLIQAGIYRSGSQQQLDNCGVTSGKYVKYSERRRVQGGVSGFKCKLYGGLKPGQTLSYTVYSKGSRGRWTVLIGSQNGGTFSVGFDTGYPMIGGELNGSGPPFRSRTSARYGSTQAWSVFGAPNRHKASRVVRSDATFLLQPTDSRWHVPLAPTPFTITH